MTAVLALQFNVDSRATRFIMQSRDAGGVPWWLALTGEDQTRRYGRVRCVRWHGHVR